MADHTGENLRRIMARLGLSKSEAEFVEIAVGILDDATVELCLDSIVAQLLYLVHTWSFFKDVDTDQMPILEPEQAINHIVAFSTAGVRHFLECRNHDR